MQQNELHSHSEPPLRRNFTSLIAALSAVMLSLLRKGDHVVSSSYLFGNTNSLWNTVAGQGVGVSFADATDAASVEAARSPAPAFSASSSACAAASGRARRAR